MCDLKSEQSAVALKLLALTRQNKYNFMTLLPLTEENK